MLAEQSRLPNRYNQTLIYIEPTQDGHICGILVHEAGNHAWRFHDVPTLFWLHEKIFAETNHPQPTHILREIDPDPEHCYKARSLQDMAIEKSEIPADKKPTFIVNVQYRHNASWQGSVKWVEGNVERHFRSALELIHLMDSVIGSTDAAWEDAE